MQLEVTIGSVSWIKLQPNPVMTAAEGIVYTPEWVPKTYIGLAATANEDPPSTITNFHDYRSTKQYRALTYSRVGLEIDDNTKAVTKAVAIDGFIDPGYTPPFNLLRPWGSSGWYPSAAVGSLKDGWKAFTSTWSFSFHAGELSPLSQIVVGSRHPHSTITGVPAAETVLANQLVKFRAGKVTDDLGVDVVGCPYHVPWVWCESLLTYSAGKFTVWGRGSVFPTQAWYLNGKQLMVQPRVGDTFFPKQRLSSVVPYSPLNNLPNPLAINERALTLYPVLSAGAPAGGAQWPLGAETALIGSVERHPYTVAGGSLNSK